MDHMSGHPLVPPAHWNTWNALHRDGHVETWKVDQDVYDMDISPIPAPDMRARHNVVH